MRALVLCNRPKNREEVSREISLIRRSSHYVRLIGCALGAPRPNARGGAGIAALPLPPQATPSCRVPLGAVPRAAGRLHPCGHPAPVRCACTTATPDPTRGRLPRPLAGATPVPCTTPPPPRPRGLLLAPLLGWQLPPRRPRQPTELECPSAVGGDSNVTLTPAARGQRPGQSATADLPRGVYNSISHTGAGECRCGGGHWQMECHTRRPKSIHAAKLQAASRS